MSARDDLLAGAITWFAQNGVGDTSVRALAAELGTSHRMVLYHFGSKDGLLVAVVEAVEREERATLEALLAQGGDLHEVGARFWAHVADRAQIFAPLFFELSGAAMQGKPYAASLRQWLASGWNEALTAGFVRLGHPPTQAAELAQLSLAVARGLLFELALTGNRAAVDAAMARFTEMSRGVEIAPPATRDDDD